MNKPEEDFGLVVELHGPRVIHRCRDCDHRFGSPPRHWQCKAHPRHLENPEYALHLVGRELDESELTDGYGFCDLIRVATQPTCPEFEPRRPASAGFVSWWRRLLAKFGL